jgi:hypothetical protein
MISLGNREEVPHGVPHFCLKCDTELKLLVQLTVILGYEIYLLCVVKQSQIFGVEISETE